MKRLRNFLDKWILEPGRRYRLFGWISVIFLFFIPLFGWNPLLFLWGCNGCLAFQESPYPKIRFIHIAVAALCFLLFLLNLWARFRKI